MNQYDFPSPLGDLTRELALIGRADLLDLVLRITENVRMDLREEYAEFFRGASGSPGFEAVRLEFAGIIDPAVSPPLKILRETGSD